MNTDSQWRKQGLVLHVQLGCGSLSITTPVSLLANGQVSLAAVNQICVIHEAMKVAKILRFIKGLLRKRKYYGNTAVIFTSSECVWIY